jgi:hypothetical protein
MPPNPFDRPDVSRMSREELIAELLDLNRGSTFRFTAAWLRRQWTHRLRSLLSATRRQHQADEPGRADCRRAGEPGLAAASPASPAGPSAVPASLGHPAGSAPLRVTSGPAPVGRRGGP